MTDYDRAQFERIAALAEEIARLRHKLYFSIGLNWLLVVIVAGLVAGLVATPR